MGGGNDTVNGAATATPLTIDDGPGADTNSANGRAALVGSGRSGPWKSLCRSGISIAVIL